MDSMDTMDQFGCELSGGSDSIQKHKDRLVKRGLCPTCRRKTHKISRFGTKREPLTVEGEVVNGHCLICRPVEGYITRNGPNHGPNGQYLGSNGPNGPDGLYGANETSSPMIPDTFEVTDDMTEISGITWDPSDFHLAPPPPSSSGGHNNGNIINNSNNFQNFQNSNLNYMHNNAQHNAQYNHGQHPQHNVSSSTTNNNYMPHNAQLLGGLMPNHFEPVYEESPMTDFGVPPRNNEGYGYGGEVAPTLSNVGNGNLRPGIQAAHATHAAQAPSYAPHAPQAAQTSSSAMPTVGAIPVNINENAAPQDQAALPTVGAIPVNRDQASLLWEAKMGYVREIGGRPPGEMTFSNLKPKRKEETNNNNASAAAAAAPAGINVTQQQSVETPETSYGQYGEMRIGAQQHHVFHGSNLPPPTEEPHKKVKLKEQPASHYNGMRQDTQHHDVLDANHLKPAFLPPKHADNITEPSPQYNNFRQSTQQHYSSNSNRIRTIDSYDAITSSHSPHYPNCYRSLSSEEYKEEIANLSEDASLDEVASIITGTDQSRLSNVEVVSSHIAHNYNSNYSNHSSSNSNSNYSNSHSNSKSKSNSNSNYKNSHSNNRNQHHQEESKTSCASIHDIPIILKCVNVYPSAKCTERAFQTLFLLATEPDPNGSIARKTILAHGGMEGLVSSLWKHMENGRVVVSLLYALWGMTVFHLRDDVGNVTNVDKNAGENVVDDEIEYMQYSISKIQECRALEALLCAMNSHSRNLTIQESGCDLIHRLAGILLLPLDHRGQRNEGREGGEKEKEEMEEKTEKTDVTEIAMFKSAIALVCTSMQYMEPNTKAYATCLLALNSLCQLSEENKREFVKCGPGLYGSVSRVLVDESLSLHTRELACRLFWCVTSDLTAVSILSSEMFLAKPLLDGMRNLPPPPIARNDIDTTSSSSSALFYEAACGTLANLALDPSNHVKMMEIDVLSTLCGGVMSYRHCENVLSETCAVLANLSAVDVGRSAILDHDGINAIFSSMKFAPDNEEVQCEALRALNNICDDGTTSSSSLSSSSSSSLSSSAKIAVASDLQVVILSYFRHADVPYIQEVTCLILFKLSMEEKARKKMISLSGTFDSLAKIMKGSTSNMSIQTTACSLLRNLSKEGAIIPILLNRGFVPLVIDAMNAYTNCEELQEKACYFLMNLASHSSEVAVEVTSGGGIKAIVTAMQTVSTSSSVQQAACSAMCAIIRDSRAHKEIAASVGAIDAIICLVLVHPNDVGVLKNAVKVLASLSAAKKLSEPIADAGGMNVIVETMRSNPSSTGIVLYGSRFLHNMTRSNAAYADEAVSGITTILACMKNHSNSVELIEGTCKALKCLVSSSESCKDRVLVANGTAVIETIMDENRNVPAIAMCTNALLDELLP